jgi:glycosyltransferase involved in cell wall biosynthesis
MRIALLSAEYPPQPGGVGDYTARLGTALGDRGHEMFVFTIVNGRLQIIDLARSNPNLQSAICNLQSDWGWNSWRAVRAALEHSRPDILHIQYQTGAYGMHPAINLLPWRLRRLRRRPRVIVTAHDLLPPYLFPKAGRLRHWVTRRLLADADAVIATNEEDYAQIDRERSNVRTFKQLAPSLPALSAVDGPKGSNVLDLIPIGNNIAVAPPPGYDRATWRAGLRVANDQTLVAYFGLISHTKGLGVLLGALARLPTNISLLVIGGAASAPEDRAYAERIQQQIAAHGLASRVTITGHCPADHVSAHLLATDLAALPFSAGASFRRGSLLAALAHGLPTVTTQSQEPRTGTRAVNREPAGDPLVLGSWFSVPRLEDGKNVLLVPPSDEQRLASAITRLAHDPELRQRLAAGGRMLAEQFAWPAIAERHEALYAQLERGGS